MLIKEFKICILISQMGVYYLFIAVLMTKTIKPVGMNFFLWIMKELCVIESQRKQKLRK